MLVSYSHSLILVDALLEEVVVVAISLLVGGVVLLFVDKYFAKNETEGTEEVSYKTAFIIGIIQSIAMIPGVSRSAATIIGGMSQKLTRKAAAEFSFFLAVPTMFAATVKSMWDEKELLIESTNNEWIILLMGNVIAFIVAYFAIKSFISFPTNFPYSLFSFSAIASDFSLIV